MSDGPLPEDMARWPTDPYRLLGVPHDVAAKDLRLAYTRLIRRFKPEQFPEQFRRIREAYEAIQNGPMRFDWAPPPPPSESPPPRIAESPPSSPADSPLPPEPPVERVWYTPPTTHEAATVDFERLWERACRGEERDVYRELQTHFRRPESWEEPAVRLYWLLRAFPEIDMGRTACDWLVDSLKRFPFGSYRELYLREIEEHPPEADSDRFKDLLDAPMPLFALAEWIEHRWRALADGRPSMVVEDVQRFRSRFAGADDRTWVRLLLAALDYLVWCRQKEKFAFVQECCREIESLTHVHSYFDLSRLDILLEMAGRGWVEVLDNVGIRIFELLPRLWRRPIQELREPLLELLQFLLSQPVRSLESLDNFQRSLPLAMVQFEQSILSLQDMPDFPRLEPASGLAYVVNEFLTGMYSGDQLANRRDILLFCLRESLLLPDFLDAADESYMPASFLHDLRFLLEDRSLRLLLIANRYYWQ